MKEKVGLRRARLLLKSTWQVSGGMVQISSVVRASVVFPWGVGGIMSIADISRGFAVCTLKQP